MKVTIITVTYNSEEFIHDCMSSVMAQTHPNIEYIIIDGNSTDRTMDIVKNTMSPFDNIKYISEPDNGIYDAINKGIKISTGDIIGILNSDDIYADNDVLKRIVREFQQNNILEAVYSDVVFVQAQDTLKPVRYYSSRGFRPGMFRFGFQPAHPTFYVKRDLFEKYGLYRTDLKISGDFELLVRFLYIHKIKYKYIKDFWVKMRVGGISTSGFKSILLLNREIVRACSENNIYTNSWMVYSKYLIKWWGFLKKTKSF